MLATAKDDTPAVRQVNLGIKHYSDTDGEGGNFACTVIFSILKALAEEVCVRANQRCVLGMAMMVREETRRLEQTMCRRIDVICRFFVDTVRRYMSARVFDYKQL